MTCLKCNTPHDQDAKFCKNCGIKLDYTSFNEEKNSKISDILLIIYICVCLLSTIAEIIITYFFLNTYESPLKYVILASIWIFRNLCFILIPFAIKNKILKIVSFIIAAITVLYWVYQSVKYMVTMYNIS